MARSTRLVMMTKNMGFLGSETFPSLRCKPVTEIKGIQIISPVLFEIVTPTLGISFL